MTQNSSLLSSTWELWRDNNNGGGGSGGGGGGVGGGWFTIGAIFIILIYHLFYNFILPKINSSFARYKPISQIPDISTPKLNESMPSLRTSELVSEGDLKYLIDNLDEKVTDAETWEHVIEKSNSSVYYKAKCCRPKDGPLKYLSTTVFENCSPEILRDFYMDCEFRKQWDKTVVAHEQLQIDQKTGVEIGRTIKKFPLLTPREYVMAWKVWEGSNKTFYCFTKECEHPLAPRQRKYVRVAIFRSGWRIRQVPGRNACEIKLVHQEDAGLNVEMAKLAFAKGIWNYVCKMDEALRKYTPSHHRLSSSVVTAVSLIQKVPHELDAISRSGSLGVPTASSSCIARPEGDVSKSRKVNRKPTKKMVANALLLLGSLICLSRGNTSFGAKVAVPFVLKKLCKRGRSPVRDHYR